MLAPLTRAIAQLDDPAILRVLAGSLALSAACFGMLCIATAYGLHHALAGIHWLGWIAGALGGLAVIVSGLWLFLPASIVIASLFMDPVCRAVERRWYPTLPDAQGAPFAAQVWDSVVVAVLVLALTLVGFLLAILVPGIGFVAGWAVTAWALGRGLFVAVAMRRMDRDEAEALYRRHRFAVLAQGGALALAGSLPLVNLLVPVLGSACMVHVLMQRGGGGAAGESWG